jgi:hypothetical protein
MLKRRMGQSVKTVLCIDLLHIKQQVAAVAKSHQQTLHKILCCTTSKTSVSIQECQNKIV